MSAETLERPVIAEAGEAEMFAHYVRKSDAARAAVMGTPVQAICGKVWIPHRDPDKFPVCPTCKDLYARLLLGA